MQLGQPLRLAVSSSSTRPRRRHDRSTVHPALAAAGLWLAVPACAPSIDSSDCDAETRCAGRGQTCDLMAQSCVQADRMTDSTDPAAPMAVDTTTVPFFRGQICLPHEVKSGARIPLSLSPCMHPCLEASSFEFKHFFSCVGSSCNAYATMWVVADSIREGCPADAFGRFDRSMCTYPADPIELGIETALASGAITGTMQLEVPFLTNADAAELAAAGNDQALFESLVFQYPQDNGRIPDGRSVQLLPEHPEPPASCDGEACPCYDVGF